jgi:excisionase family DNA binding protein
MTVRGTNGEPIRPEARVTDVAGAATYLATSERHIRELVYTRVIPFYKVGRKLRFDLKDLDRWLRNHRTEAAS